MIEKVVTEQVEVVDSDDAVQVRTATQFVEDGIPAGEPAYHRHVIMAGDDYSGESQKVIDICDVTFNEVNIAIL